MSIGEEIIGGGGDSGGGSPGSGGSTTGDVIDLGGPSVLPDPQEEDPTTQPPAGGCGHVAYLINRQGACLPEHRLKLFVCDISCEHLKGACRQNCRREEKPHSDQISVEVGTCVPANANVAVQWGWTVVLPNGRKRFEWEPRLSDPCTVSPKDRLCTFSKSLTTGTANNFNGPPSQCSKYTFKVRLIEQVGNRTRVRDTLSLTVDCHKCYLEDTPDIEVVDIPVP